MAHIDSAYKLLTSTDPSVATDAVIPLDETAHKRIREPPDAPTRYDFLSGQNEGALRGPSAGVANIWTRSWNASRRTGVIWSTESSDPVILIPAATITIRRKQRRQIFRTMRQAAQTMRARVLIDKPDQGRAMECAVAHAVANHFLREYIRFTDWKFIHRVCLNLAHFNGSATWRAGDHRCRRCGYKTENLAHVLDYCMRYTDLYLARHNSIVKRIKTVVGKKFDIVAENQVVRSGNQRPDLLLKRKSDGKIFVIETTVPFDNRLVAFKAAADERRTRYDALRQEMSTDQQAEIVPIVVGALGAWDPDNDEFIQKLCSRSYPTMMRKLCVSEVIAGYLHPAPH